MIVKFCIGVAVALSLTATMARAAAPLEVFGRLPSVESIEISPDGDQLAILLGKNGGHQLQVRRASDLSLTFLGELGDHKVRALEWVGSRKILVIHSTTYKPIELSGPKSEYFLVAQLDLDHKTMTPLLHDAEHAMNTTLDVPTIVDVNGHPQIFVEGISFVGGRGARSLFQIDPGSKVTHLVEQGDERTAGFLVGAGGEVVARADYIQHSGQWTLLLHKGAAWRPVRTENAPLDPPVLEGLGSDGQSALVKVRGEDGWETHAVGLKDEQWSGPLDTFRAGKPILDPRTRTAIGAEFHGEDHMIYTFLSPRDQAAWDSVARAFPKEQLQLVSWSDDRRKVVVKVEGVRDGAAFFIVDLSKGSANWIAHEYADIDPDTAAEQKVIHYKAADGLDIPAYLTLPKDRAAKALPLIVLAHGGPASYDSPGFDWWAQALASRGYAVLQPEFRGSTGFGQAHLEAGYGQWGRKMQTDLSDGVRALAALGQIDPKRVCIVGASYGGYAALAGAIFEPSVYRCAVSVAGVADLSRMLAAEHEAELDEATESQRYWLRFMGAKTRHDPVLDDLSPALHAERAEAPILLIHGQDDTVVPFGQSQEMADALKRAGKSVDFVTLKREDHWLSRSATRLEMLTATIAFVEAHNPPDPAPKLP